jgi:hypothetical protein
MHRCRYLSLDYLSFDERIRHMLASNLLRVSVVIILFGMIMGLAMGILEDFRLAPAHAHLNLLGFVSLFLAGLYYHAVPSAAATMLATVQAWISVIGAIVFPIGIAVVALKGIDYVIFPIIGSLVAFTGMLLFAIVVFRHGAPVAVRPAPASGNRAQ